MNLLSRSLALSSIALAMLALKPANAQDMMYGYDNASHQLVSINPLTAAVTNIGSSGLSGSITAVQSLAYNPFDGLYGIGYDGGNYRMLKFNVGTGSGTLVGPLLGIGASSADGFEYIDSMSSFIMFKSPGNNFYATALNTISTSGILTPTGVTSVSSDNDHGVFDSRRGQYYTIDDNEGALNRINLTTGGRTSLASLNGHFGDGAYSKSSDKLFQTGDTGTNLYNFSAATPGTPASLVGNFGSGRSITAIAVVSAPEPGTVALFGLGLIGFCGRRFKRRAR